MKGIYAIHNKLNGKCYIGQTVNIDIRYKEHLMHLRNNKHSNNHLQNAWNRYGEDCFEFLILEECNEEELDEREQYWIDYYGGINSFNTYNIREAGSHGRHSDETKQKLRDSHIGKCVSEETRLKISSSLKLRGTHGPLTEKHRQAVIKGCNTEEEILRRTENAKRQWCNKDYRDKMTNLWKGKHHTEETKEKQRRIAKERCLSPEFKVLLAKAHAKAVCQFDKKGNLLALYPSVLEASRVTGITHGSIYYSCNNPKSVSKNNYFWRYKKDVKNI